MIEDSNKILLYDFNSLKIFECEQALILVNNSHFDIKSAFLIKNGRKPNQEDLDFIQNKRFDNSPTCFYDMHTYCAQILKNKYNFLPISTKTIKEEYKTLNNIDILNNDTIHIINNNYKKIPKFSISNYKCINIRQLMIICHCLIENNINKSDQNIKLLFNKIYKRDPINKEYALCKILDITKDKLEVKNEVNKFCEIRDESNHRGWSYS